MHLQALFDNQSYLRYACMRMRVKPEFSSKIEKAPLSVRLDPGLRNEMNAHRTKHGWSWPHFLKILFDEFAKREAKKHR